MTFAAGKSHTDKNNRGKTSTTNHTRSMRIVLWTGIAWAAVLLFMAVGAEALLQRAAAHAVTLRQANAGGRSLRARLLRLSAAVSTAEAQYAEIERRLRLKDAKARAWDRMMTLVGNDKRERR